MDKARYQAAKPIYEVASELAPEAREEFLSQSCGEDAELRALVGELLAADEQMREENPGLFRSIERSIAVEEEPGARVGRYELREPLGEGGFGTVWRAEQHEPVRRDVALKILKLGMDTKQIVARFEAERQALAMMDHPHIAQVYDGGITERGRSYFAMELVRGEPITRFAERHDLSLRQRLDLFVRVCAALQHAHQKGIIHRDVKPSNVLVSMQDGLPFPKVIDFGIAKAISPDGAPHTVLTENNQIIGTPEYMAPEQIEGTNLDIDTRADVYSLGVLLYELLTGSRPFQLRDSVQLKLHDLFETIRKETPPKPSTRVSASTRGRPTTGSEAASTRWGTSLRGDLDWIVMRALEKERDDRYQNVEALAADISRHLRHEPVSAGPPSVRYRMRKFVARNFASVVGGVLVFFALVAGLVSTGIALSWALEERDRADAKATQASQRLTLALDAIDEFHTGVAEDVVLRQPGLKSLRTRLLRSPVAFYERLRKDLEGSEEPEQRAALARALASLAGLLESVGSRQASISEYQKAVTVLRGLADSGYEPAATRFEIARTLGILGRIQTEAGMAGAARATLSESVAITEQLKAAAPESTEYDLHLAEALGDLGSSFHALGDLEQSLALWNRSLAFFEAQAQTRPTHLRTQEGIAATCNAIGRVALNSGEIQTAKDAFTKARTTLDRLVQRKDSTASLRLRLANACGNLGNARSRSGDEEGARKVYVEAIRHARSLTRAFPSVVDYRAALGNLYGSIAGTYHALGDKKRAATAYRSALDTLDGLKATDSRRCFAMAAKNFAKFQEREGEEKAARELFERALAVYVELAEETSDPDVLSGSADCHNDFALLIGSEGDARRSESLLRASIALRDRVRVAYPDSSAQALRHAGTLCNLGRLLQNQGEPAKSLEHLDRAIALIEDLHAKVDRTSRLRTQLHQFRLRCYWARANSRQMLNQHEASAADWVMAASLDSGRMRAPMLTQLAYELGLAKKLGDPEATVDLMLHRCHATPGNLGRIAAALLEADDNQIYRPFALALAKRAVALAEANQSEDLWRHLDVLASAQMQNEDLDGAFASQKRALTVAPADVAPRFRRVLEGRMRRIEAAREKR